MNKEMKMKQEYYYKNYYLVVVFFIILLILFLIEFIFFAPLIASLTLIPLLPVLFFLKADYLYVIHNGRLDIFINKHKTVSLNIDEIKSARKTQSLFKKKIVLISKSNQEFNIYIKKEEIDKFLSNF